ncbi:hypothetical protein PENTCL1PPCAC_9037, partial [Pristionchus entomophagus]
LSPLPSLLLPSFLALLLIAGGFLPPLAPMPSLLLLALFLPLLFAANTPDPDPIVIPADGENGPKVYGVDLHDCKEAMCWTGESCGFGIKSGKLKMLNVSDTVTCRNVIYVRRQTAYSISIEIMWEATNMAISIRPQTKEGFIDTKDFFVCSSIGGQSVATTTSSHVYLFQRATPLNLGPTKMLTYCRFDIKTREKIGNFMQKKKIASLCAFVKMTANTAAEVQCMRIRHDGTFYNTFNVNKAFLVQQEKIYSVFLVAFLMTLALVAYPMYDAWSESLVNFRLMRAYFKFRRTLIELPEEDMRRWQARVDARGSRELQGGTEGDAREA